jgi:hypothetical protein
MNHRTNHSKLTQSNFISGKPGIRLSNFPVHDLFFTAEYTRTNPMVYRDYISTSTFASGNYNLGHYLGDNAEEIFLSAMYKPVAKFCAEVFYSQAQKGMEYPYTGQSSGQGIAFMNVVRWQAIEFGVKTQYQAVNDGYVFAGMIMSDYRGWIQRYIPNHICVERKSRSISG